MSNIFINYNGDNPVLVFGKVVKRLKEIAEERRISEYQIVDEFIQDLRNLNVEEYKKNIDEITIKTMPEEIRKALIDYLIKVSKDLKNREKMAKEKEKKKPKRESQKKKTSREDENKKVLEESKRQEKVNYLWAEICSKVEEESLKGTKNIAQCWILVRQAINESRKTKNMTIAEKRISQMLDEEVYYQEIKYFTYEFDFLKEYPEIAKMTTVGRMHLDKQAGRKYFDLRLKLQELGEEKRAIQYLLQNPETDNADKRVLEARLSVIQKKENDRKKEIER